MSTVMRWVIAVIGAGLVLTGLIVLAAGEPGPGLWSIVVGGVAIVAVTLERTRYRSAAAERGAQDHGPGGGETSRPEAPFRPTDEIFIDPTSGHRLRVYLDASTGERRYFAE
jgi:hypothetical protein